MSYDDDPTEKPKERVRPTEDTRLLPLAAPEETPSSIAGADTVAADLGALGVDPPTQEIIKRPPVVDASTVPDLRAEEIVKRVAQAGAGVPAYRPGMPASEDTAPLAVPSTLDTQPVPIPKRTPIPLAVTDTLLPSAGVVAPPEPKTAELPRPRGAPVVPIVIVLVLALVAIGLFVTS